MAQAKTGSGKTLAFLLPIIEQVMRRPASAPAAWPLYQVRTKPSVRTPVFGSAPDAGIGAPDRNGATKICSDVRDLLVGLWRDADRAPLPCAATTADGGGRYAGRLLDLAGSGHLYLGGVTFLVMDEADQMLDRGFLRDIQRIIRLLPAERQTLLFSATFSGEIQTLAQTMQRNPASISVDPGISTPTTIVHAYYVVPGDHARTQLVHTLLQTVKGGETVDGVL